MPIEQYAKEMEGHILITDNKKFVYCISFIGLYYIAFLGFLTHVIIHAH